MAYDNLVNALIKAESGGNRYAQNNRSSAGGLGQFIDSTWLSMVKRHRPDVAAGKTDAQLLQLKYDPNLSAEMTQAYAQDNASFLRNRGVEPDAAAISLAHFAGPEGAARAYANPNETVRNILGDAAVKANPFMAQKGINTGADLIAWAGRRVGDKSAPSGGQAIGQTYEQPQAQSQGMERLKAAAIGATYDPEGLNKATSLVEAAQKMGANARDPYSAIGAIVLAGIGASMEESEKENKAAFDKEFSGALQNVQSNDQLARLLLQSPDEKQKAAGLNLLAQNLGPKAAPEIKTFEDAYGRKSYATWDAQSGQYKPVSIGDAQQALQGSQMPTQQAQPQQGIIPAIKSPEQMQQEQSVIAQGGQDMRQNAAPQNEQIQQPVQGNQQAAIPEGMVKGPAVPKSPEGYIHKLAPDGSGYLYNSDGTPVFETKDQAKARAELQSKQSEQLTAEQKVAQQFAGGLSQLQRFPEEFGKRAFERAIGPLQGSPNEGDGSGFWGSGVSLNSVTRIIPNLISEADTYVSGGANPTEVRDRIETATKNLAAVMKPLIRKPGEGAWTDKDQENLEKQLGTLTRSRDTGEYLRRWEDIKGNVSRIFKIEIPEIQKADVNKDPSLKAKEDSPSIIQYLGDAYGLSNSGKETATQKLIERADNNIKPVDATARRLELINQGFNPEDVRNLSDDQVLSGVTPDRKKEDDLKRFNEYLKKAAMGKANEDFRMRF